MEVLAIPHDGPADRGEERASPGQVVRQDRGAGIRERGVRGFEQVALRIDQAQLRGSVRKSQSLGVGSKTTRSLVHRCTSFFSGGATIADRRGQLLTRRGSSRSYF